MKKKVETKTKTSKYCSLQNSFVKKNTSFFTTGACKEVFDAISTGYNQYLRINRVETSSFDNEWIKKIEECIPELESIVRNPRGTTQTVGNVVPIELARKTNSESVIHLATHTQYVKEIKDNGEVIPSKILSIGNEDFFQTYENRFIATLIRRLVLFVEKRYEFIVEHALLKDVEVLQMKSKSVIDGSVVELETKVKIVKPADYEGIQEKNRYVERVIELRNHLKYCYGSIFMKSLKTEKDVRNPIIMTNILRKNPTYHKCYVLFKYIEGYTEAGVSYSVNDEFIKADKQMLDEINMALTTSFLSVRSNNPSLYAFEKKKTYKPKILTSIDDEEFVYGPYLEGPIEFVRVDEKFRKATEVTNSFYHLEDVYGKPFKYEPKKEKIMGFMKKEEEEYIAEQRLENRSIHLMREAKDQLYNRKRRESLVFDRKAISIINNRDKEEKDLRIKLSEEQRLAKLMIEKEARQRLIDSAKNDMMNEEAFKDVFKASIEEQAKEAAKKQAAKKKTTKKKTDKKKTKPVKKLTDIIEPIDEKNNNSDFEASNTAEEKPVEKKAKKASKPKKKTAKKASSKKKEINKAPAKKKRTTIKNTLNSKLAEKDKLKEKVKVEEPVVEVIEPEQIERKMSRKQKRNAKKAALISNDNAVNNEERVNLVDGPDINFSYQKYIKKRSKKFKKNR